MAENVLEFCSSFSPSLNLSFPKPVSLCLYLLPPFRCPSFQYNSHQFNLLMVWNLMVIKDPFHMIEPIHKFIWIKPTSKLWKVNLEIDFQKSDKSYF